ncbi:hypothetical protein AGMMS4956_05110 [Bacteroidia bacterium]|nr:hypothetical protein AGMMS4956_05110 [Bacteroidia bacterium]
METIEVSSNNFRTRQKKFLDMSDQGIRIILRRNNKSYTVMPVSSSVSNDKEYDEYFTPDMLARIDRSLEQVAQGKVKSCIGL